MSVAIPSLRGAIAVPEWAKNELWRKAQAAPSLDLRFADFKSLADAVTGTNLIDFTRASGGTYVGSDGLIKTATTNEPRFNHDPTTGESLGLLVEESRTNLLLWSEEFDNASWTKTTLTVTPNQAIAPNGQLSADEVTYGSGTAQLEQGVTVTSGATYVASIYAKAGSGNLIRWREDDEDALGVVVDLSDGSILGGSGSATAVGNGWYRISFAGSVGGTTFRPEVRLQETGSIYLWGAQLEAGSFPTSYIPTAGSAVTRAADVASSSGSNFSSWYRQDEGTVFVDYVPLVSLPPSNQAIFTAESTTNNGFRLYQQGSTGRPLGQWQTPAGLQANFPFTVLNMSAGVSTKTTAAYADADFAGTSSIGIGNVSTIDTGVVPTGLIAAGIGSRSSNSTFFANGTIRRITYWPQRLPNDTLKTITT